jgi:hypothetical protein
MGTSRMLFSSVGPMKVSKIRKARCIEEACDILFENEKTETIFPAVLTLVPGMMSGTVEWEAFHPYRKTWEPMNLSYSRDGETPHKARKKKSHTNTSAQSSISIQEIKEVVDANSKQINDCFRRYSISNSKKISIRASWVVTANGRVKSVTTKRKKGQKSDPHEKCIIEKIRKWKFPRLRGGGHANVSYPFEYQPKQD